MRLDFSNSHQLLVFLISISLGFLFSIIFDLFKFLRMVKKWNDISIFFQDIFFFFICGIITFCFFILYTKGSIRSYVYIGEIIGFVICKFTISKFIIKMFKFFIDIGVKIIKFLEKPIRHFKYKLNKIIEKLKGIIKNRLKGPKKSKKL